ncbi:hypothetical protein HMPREF3121_05645 [Corynebacterium sp. HMSC11E11]|nr:hypothetical protein HMPREF3121_05645 [Corynebacterium sp. HMSC11E11]
MRLITAFLSTAIGSLLSVFEAISKLIGIFPRRRTVGQRSLWRRLKEFTGINGKCLNGTAFR